MKLFQRTAMGMLLIVLSAAGASAALTGDTDGDGRNIELRNSDVQPTPFDQLLNLGELNETVLQRHARSAQPTQAPMDGQYGREGAESPQLYGSQSLTQSVVRYSVPEMMVNPLALGAVHMVGSGAVSVSAAAPVMPATDSSSESQIVLNGTNENNTNGASGGNNTTIPLPPSVLLMASGLLTLPLARRRFQPAW